MNDADRLSLDPVMRWIVGGHAVTKQAASSSQMGRFETEVLAPEENLTALADLSGQWIDRVHERHPPKMIVLDMDSSVSPTHGDQEGSAYNGHFGCSCYHPLFVFNQFGDLERSSLRPGNVHSADGWRDVLEPVIERYRKRDLRRYFRGDAAFASPDIYEFLEAEAYTYAIRLKANAVLQESIAHLLSRPVGRPPNHVRRYYASFSYQAGSWERKRRIVAKVEWHPGELYPRVGFIVTNLSRPGGTCGRLLQSARQSQLAAGERRSPTAAAARRAAQGSVPPGRYFRMHLVGYFEGIDSERGLEWRCSDSLSLREFLLLEMRERVPDHSWLSRTRARLPHEVHTAVFDWVLALIAEAGLVKGERIGVDASTMEANAALRNIVRRDTGEGYRGMLERLAQESGIETPTAEDLARLDRKRKGKKLSNQDWVSRSNPEAKIAKMKDGTTHLAYKPEHAVDMDTGAVVAAELHPADEGDTITLPRTGRGCTDSRRCAAPRG